MRYKESYDFIIKITRDMSVIWGFQREGDIVLVNGGNLLNFKDGVRVQSTHGQDGSDKFAVGKDCIIVHIFTAHNAGDYSVIKDYYENLLGITIAPLRSEP
jgi:hypothetical protein